MAGRRCLRAMRSFASGSYRLFGTRTGGEPPLFAPEKTTSVATRMEMLGWQIDTVRMTVAVTPEKIANTQALLAEWPDDRRPACVHEVRSLLGKLLHLCEVVRPGKFFIRRILNQLGLAPLQVGAGRLPPARRRDTLTLTREFHADLAFWRLVFEMSTGPDGVVRLEAPLLVSSTAISCSC